MHLQSPGWKIKRHLLRLQGRAAANPRGNTSANEALKPKAEMKCSWLEQFSNAIVESLRFFCFVCFK